MSDKAGGVGGPDYSIVIIAWNHRETTERCLDSLDAAFGDRLGRDVELVLLDNGSTDDTGRLLDRWEDRATVVRLPENRFFSGGMNAAVAAASGEVVIPLNNDTLVPAGALDVLAEQARDPSVGLVGVRLLYPSGRLQHGGSGFRDVDGDLRPFHLFHHEQGDLPAARCVVDMDNVTGACVAIRRELYLEMGGFDEGYRNGWEDTDLCLKLRTRGLRVVYRGDVHVVHDEGVTVAQDYTAEDRSRRFREIWGGLVGDEADWLAQRFDAVFGPFIDARYGAGAQPGGAPLEVHAPLVGLSPDADEMRALLAALRGGGVDVAARDLAPVWIWPRLEPAESQTLFAAIRRPRRPRAQVLRAAVRGAGPGGGGPAMVRWAGGDAAALEGAETVWAAGERSARSAVDAGVAAERVRVLAPPVPARPIGPGGQGILVLLPAHDLARCAAVLDVLDISCDVLLSADVEGVRPLLDGRPELRALAPVSSEERFAAVAGCYDLVVCADADDRYQRRALIAASVGATPVLLDDGPAAEVLDGVAAVAAPETLRAALDAGPGEREALAARVRERCDPERLAATVAARMAELEPGDDERPGLLVVAPTVPLPDGDADSAPPGELLDALATDGCAISYLAGSVAAEHEPHAEALERAGIDVYGPRVDLGALLGRRFHPYVLLVGADLAAACADQIRRLSPLSRIVVQADGALTLSEEDEIAPAEASAAGWRALATARDEPRLVVGSLAGDDDALRALLGAYCGAFAPEDPVSLVLAVPAAHDRAAALNRVAALVAELGHDPSAIPDVTLNDLLDPSVHPLPADAWLAGAQRPGLRSLPAEPRVEDLRAALRPAA